MDRRSFLSYAGIMAGFLGCEGGFRSWLSPLRLYAAEMPEAEANPNIADPKRGATATASSHSSTLVNPV
jgi:hypothetical protein